jgi:hypothetical protein
VNGKREVVHILTPIKWKIVPPTVLDGRCVLVCDQLGLATESEDAKQAVETINSAISLLFNDLEESGEFADFCQKKGLEYRSIPEDPEEIVVFPEIRHALSH